MGVGHFVDDIREYVHFVQAKESFMQMQKSFSATHYFHNLNDVQVSCRIIIQWLCGWFGLRFFLNI